MHRLIEGYRQFRANVWPAERARYEALAKWGQRPETLVVACSDSRVDPQTVFGAVPGEIFTGWGLEIKRYSPARQTFVVELASSHDGMTGYKATTDQALRGARGKGAYGALPTLSQRHCSEAGEIMTDAAISLLYELWPEFLRGRGGP